ncbi:MAG: hypothetical protein RLZZ136_316 [Pseudomonadota bacterium]
MTATSGSRIAVLDLIRGVAILGILAVNIEGFAGPIAATLSPDWNGPVSGPSHFAFAAVLILFEGKMRALLSLLFGASMLLFIESAEAADRDGDRLQLRRLCWLAVIGYLHSALAWWGDILFTYAFAGFFALLLRHLSPRTMVAAALMAFAIWHGGNALENLPSVRSEIQFIAGTASPSEQATLWQERARDHQDTLAEQRREQGGYLPLVRHKFSEEAALPLIMAVNTFGEVLPLMLLGMALFRSGFFTGGWPAGKLRGIALWGIGAGGVTTIAITAFAWTHGFPPRMMNAILAWWMALPHLAMALGFAAVLVLKAPVLGNSALGRRIIAVGRMALSNYLGCTLMMTALFYGWGLGLMGKVPESLYWPFILGGWVVMLWASPLWLRRYRQGPVEWLWRSLTTWQFQIFRR